MKRARIFLLTLAVLTTVGAALAFKAQKYGTVDYCFVQANTTSLCTDIVLQKSPRAWNGSETKVYYTIAPSTDPADCEDISCDKFGVPDQL
jgi:hypothetical protein